MKLNSAVWYLEAGRDAMTMARLVNKTNIRKGDDMKNEGIKKLLSETFEGNQGNWSWFTESKPGSGLFGTIDPLSAEEASVPVEGVTIAAHTDHTRYYLWANNQLLEGKTPDLNWDESWEVGTVAKDEWDQIKKGLQREYMKMIEHISEDRNLNSAATDNLLAALAHSTYHLGAMRQMIKRVK
ncbi:hypothetical protein [Alteribacillus sp. HJP-4]|uniref:hypothetical protein n=1 Tax=Alteribacillus sp. HJP-4 TaxID=2775394 RepID=UPI0035CD25C1